MLASSMLRVCQIARLRTTLRMAGGPARLRLSPVNRRQSCIGAYPTIQLVTTDLHFLCSFFAGFCILDIRQLVFTCGDYYANDCSKYANNGQYSGSNE
jgi:hypothetical protein